MGGIYPSIICSPQVRCNRVGNILNSAGKADAVSNEQFSSRTNDAFPH